MAFPLMLLLAGATAMQQQNAAKAQEIEIERQADQEKLSAEAREIERRQALNKALSANIVDMANSGMTGAGTPQSIALENAKQASASEGLIGLSDRMRQAALKRKGSNIASMGRTQAASTMLTGANQAYQVS